MMTDSMVQALLTLHKGEKLLTFARDDKDATLPAAELDDLITVVQWTVGKLMAHWRDEVGDPGNQ